MRALRSLLLECRSRFTLSFLHIMQKIVVPKYKNTNRVKISTNGFYHKKDAAAQPYVRSFSEIGMNDISEVGGKNASLGAMLQHLGDRGVCVPDGFAVTTTAYRKFIHANNLEPKIANALSALDRS